MVAPRTSKSITAWWLLSNLKQVPLDMKRQIKEKHQIFPNTNLDPLVKSGAYLQLRSFTFLRRTISIYDHFTPWQLVAVPKLQFLRKHCWHQMEQHRRTSFEPCRETCNSGTCAISKTTMVAPKTSKTITAALLASNFKQTPLVMQCQISNENRSSSRKSWIPLGQLMTTYKFTASFLGSAQSLFGTNSDHGSW